MNYKQQEDTKELISFIKNNFNVEELQRESVEDIQAKNMDLSWEASRFWANIINKSFNQTPPLTLERFKKFQKNYELKNKVIVKTDELFEKYWLRNILGIVKIVTEVSSAVYRFKQILPYKEELKFLSQYYVEIIKNGQKNITKNDLNSAIKSYQRKNKVTLKDEGINLKSWLSEKNGKIEISDIDLYFKSYLDYWDEFLFLNELYNEINSKKSNLLIKVIDFDTLQSQYQIVYPNIFSPKEFIKQKIIKKIGSKYVINFFESEIKYSQRLRDKISGYYWELLIQDVELKKDEDKIKKWTEVISCCNSWPNPLDFVTNTSKNRFLDAALNLIINDSDLEGVQDEFLKVRLDTNNHHGILLMNKELIGFVDFSLDNNNLYELLESLNRWEERANTTYLHSQNTRHTLANLIMIIIKHDTNYYARSIQLLRAGITKPYLLWEATRFVIRYKPEIIPFLLIQKDLASLSFILIDSINFPEEQKYFLVKEFWKKAIEIMLENILQLEIEYQEVSVILFQVYRQLNYSKYNIPYNRNKKREIKFRSELDQKEIEILSLIENTFLTNKNSEYLLPRLFKYLSALFVDFKIKPLYRNGTIQFPMLQWDGMIWLLKITTYWKYKNQFVGLTVEIKNLTNAFFTLYLENIEIKEVSTYNFIEEKNEISIPLWSEKIERLEYLDWLYPVYLTYKQGNLNIFLSPRFNFNPSEEFDNKQNQFTADKLRTHIGVLLQVLKKLVLPSIPLGFEKDEIKIIKNRIEEQIIDYLKIHVRDIPEEGKVDLFHFNKELRFQSSDKEALLPQIARAINWFDNKEPVIDIILKSGDIAKILTLLNDITSEGIKNTLLEKIQELDIRTILEEYRWIPEVQNILFKMSRYPQLIKQTEKAIQYWEEEIIAKRNTVEYIDLLYQTKLLLAYFKNDESELDQVSEPQRNYVPSSSQVNDSDYKEFYRGLIYIKENPKKAYTIFNNLTLRKPTYPSFALNRALSKINWAESENSSSLYQEAYEEWQIYFNNATKDVIELVEPDYSSILFHLLNKLNKFDDADKVFLNLELPSKMLPSILDERIDSLIIQKRNDEALILIDSAKIYHQYTAISDIQFVQELEKRVYGIDNIEELRGHYLRIYSSLPKNLVKIFPDNLNGQIDLDRFIVKEFILSLNKMLEKIKSIEEIKNEDKYNDIVELTLDARINPWGWYVGAQSRGGYSATEESKNPGERDLPLTDQNKKIIMVCEAFIYRGETTAKAHLIKIFNYYHQKNSFLILVYDTGVEGNDFEKNWNKYVNEIIPKTSFSCDYQLKDKAIDITEEFDCKNSAIKVGISNHGDSTKIYHLFVNINYKV